MKVAIVDYSLGNLFSVKQACEAVGLQAIITASKNEIFQADGVILPGVGAFGDAMQALKQLDLICPLKDIAASPIPLFGICLGMQLLMTESYEFGTHQGLDIISGTVVRFEKPMRANQVLKVPQVGWNTITQPENHSWKGSPLEGLANGEFMYFVHSYYVQPESADVVLATSQYGTVEFCSSLQSGTVFACQFHPERSGQSGLNIYRNIHALIQQNQGGKYA